MESSPPIGEKRCCLCAQIAGDASGDLLHRILGGGDYERRVLTESEHAVVFPSIGPLAAGHVLVCPKEHRRSTASASAVEFEEINLLGDRIAMALREALGEDVHRFEHGDALAGSEVSCSVEHAHLHLLPSKADPWALLRHEFRWERLAGRTELREFAGDLEYLFYETPAGECYAFLSQGQVPSQLLRQRFAESMGIAEAWNWRETPRQALIASTYELLEATPSGH